MLESDLMLQPGTEDTVMLAHPPQASSDLTLEDYLQAIKIHNTRNPQVRKGIKLDFKQPAAVLSGLRALTYIWGKIGT